MRMKSSTDCDRLEYPDPGEDDRALSGLDECGLADADAYDEGARYQGTDEQDDVWYRDTDSYWRRRFFVLAGGLAIVGGIMWGLSVLVGPARAVHAGGSPHASMAVQDTLPSVALGAPAGSRASSSASTAASPAASSPRPSPAPSTSSGSAASVTTLAPSRGSSPSRAVTCSPSAIVLSLFTTQAQYGPGQQPQFEVYAVSTAPGSCTLAFGASLVRVVVTRHGQVLWDSSACPASATAARPVRFTQGVPQVAALSWNREAGTPGCAGSVPAGTWGTVDSVALADGRSSPVRSFTLKR
jgi:hypothetical protein